MELKAKKSLGQHFLNSPSVLAKIIEAADLRNGENVLEIGPGTGILTGALLKSGVRVTAVEKDSRSIDILKEKFGQEIESGSLHLVCADILECDRSSLGMENSGYKLIANIPYYITGQILESFLEKEPRPTKAVLLVQKEVAERIVSRDGKESILSISVKAFGKPRIVSKVPRGAFVPPPSVDSAILEIDHISDGMFKENALDISHFFKILKKGFSHKRKLLKNNLSEALSEEKTDLIWQKIPLPDMIRAEDVSVENWVAIARLSCE